MNLEVELIAGVIKGGLPPAHLPAPRLIKIFIIGERNGKKSVESEILCESYEKLWVRIREWLKNKLLINRELYININIKYEIKSIWQLYSLDFPEERKQLLEMVGPELQSIYDDMGIEVSKRISFILVIELICKCVLLRFV